MAYELDRGWEVGVLGTAVHLDGINSVLVNALGAYAIVSVHHGSQSKGEKMVLLT